MNLKEVKIRMCDEQDIKEILEYLKVNPGEKEDFIMQILDNEVEIHLDNEVELHHTKSDKAKGIELDKVEKFIKLLSNHNHNEFNDIREKLEPTTLSNRELTKKVNFKGVKFGIVNAIETEMYDNMQYYMEYCQSNEYVTPQHWLENLKHF
jgi:hypothetical protein